MNESTGSARAWLIADVGATSSRCAIVVEPGFALGDWQVFRNDEFDSLESLLGDYVAGHGGQPQGCALAVAAPIHGNSVRMINRDWQFDRDSVGAALGVDEVRFVNDFHAIAYFLPVIDSTCRVEIGSATEYRDETIAVLGPGSGLGMAAWIGSRGDGRTMTGEGGHISIAGRNTFEDQIIARLRERFGHCSAERVLSGPGIVALHQAIHGDSVAAPEDITANLADEKCAATMQQFFRFLGSIAAELALITGAFGGVYIAGGIVPALVDDIAASEFRERFEDKNRYRKYMQRIPTYVITDPVPGLRGLTAMLARSQ